MRAPHYALMVFLMGVCVITLGTAGLGSNTADAALRRVDSTNPLPLVVVKPRSDVECL